jgi:hypothetical protein
MQKFQAFNIAKRFNLSKVSRPFSTATFGPKLDEHGEPRFLE